MFAEEVAITPPPARDSDTMSWPTLYVKKERPDALYLRIESPGPGITVAVKDLVEALRMVGIDLRHTLLT